VHRVEDDWDPQQVLCSVYQMRNFYRQFGDGFFSILDVMNYIQHHQVVRWTKPGNHLLDVCCGRGLLLPLLRYQRKDLGSYTGVDIAPANATFTRQRVTDGHPLPADYYPFPVSFVDSNVAVMSQVLPRRYDVIVYTSALEHMHPDMGLASLHECRTVSRPGAILILTCPNTAEGADGYQTQYRAHVYEWKRSELLAGLQAAGFQLVTEYGLLVDKRTLLREGERLGLKPLIERLAAFIPPEWLLPVFAPMFPTQSKEIGLIAKAV
jgi:SAM-dependent methyltransferase